MNQLLAPPVRTLETLQDDDAFSVQKVEYEGTACILKTLKPGAREYRKRCFHHEVAWGQIVHEYAQQNPDANLSPPEIKIATPTWMLRDFVEGELLCEGRTGGNISKQSIDDMTRTLLAFDAVSVPSMVSGRLGEPEDSLYFEATRWLRPWTNEALAKGILKPQQVKSALDLIADYLPHVRPGFQHGDFVPDKHVFRLANGRISIIDGEHGSTLKPRYYDLCAAYTRIFAQLQRPDCAAALLRAFVERSPEKSQKIEAGILPVLTRMAIVVYSSVLLEPSNKLYQEHADRLLAACFQRDISAFIAK